MAVSRAFRDFVLAQLDELDDISARPMFGELGLYHRGTFFGIVADDRLFLRVDDESRKECEAEGMHPFSPNGFTSSRRYYSVPLGVLESAAELIPRVRRAVAAARSPAAPRRSRARTRGRQS